MAEKKAISVSIAIVLLFLYRFIPIVKKNNSDFYEK